MDRALKERIIGAAVLVVFVVLVVPVFLDGPPQSGEIVSERVPLPGQAAETETRTVVLERDRDEPVPVPAPVAEPQAQPQHTAGPVSQPEPESQPVSAARAEPEPEPGPAKPAAQQAAPENASSTGMWAVQLGSFGNQENAERLAADLRKQGFAAFLSQLSTDSGQLHRVRIGPQKDRESAEAVAARLAKAGHKGQVVPHP
jgi:DedD protein